MARAYRAIFSPSYSGSTLLSSLINSFADTTSVGELHWSLDHEIERIRCSECGKKCPIVGSLIKRRERGDLSDSNLYSSVLEITRKSNLFTSDKIMHNVIRFLPDGGDGAIVLFKAPQQLYASGKRHVAPWIWDFFSESSVYLKMYQSLLGWLPTWTKKVYFCNYNLLTLDPETEMDSIRQFFGLKYKVGKLQYPPVKWHNLFGNSAWKNDYFNREIKQDTRWEQELTPTEKKKVLSCPSQTMYNELSRLADQSRRNKER